MNTDAATLIIILSLALAYAAFFAHAVTLLLKPRKNFQRIFGSTFQFSEDFEGLMLR